MVGLLIIETYNILPVSQNAQFVQRTCAFVINQPGIINATLA
jgi:hypothetical protein